jgi:hypothetical protein
MATGQSIMKSPIWAIALILITTVSVVYAIDTGGRASTTAVDVKQLQTEVHSLDIDRNISKTQYLDIKDTMLKGFADQKEATSELKSLLQNHITRASPSVSVNP